MSADVIGENNEDNVKRLTIDVDSLSSPNALPSADRFDNVNYTTLAIQCFYTVG